MGLLVIAVACAALFAACTTTTTEGWTVSCIATDVRVCGSVASLALNNMARSRPREPSGIITVVARGRCSPVPDWADGSMCFDAHIPLSSSQKVCLVIAARSGSGDFGQIGGDRVSGGANLPGRGPALACAT